MKGIGYGFLGAMIHTFIRESFWYGRPGGMFGGYGGGAMMHPGTSALANTSPPYYNVGMGPGNMPPMPPALARGMYA